MQVLDGHTHIFPPEMIRQREKIAGRDRGFAAIYGDSRSRMADADGLVAYMDREGVDRVVTGCFPFTDAARIRLANDYVLDMARKDARIIPLFSSIGTMRIKPWPRPGAASSRAREAWGR